MREDCLAKYLELTRRLQEDEIIQANLWASYPGMIKTWHRQGASKICMMIPSKK